MERLTKTYSDGTHGAADNLPCGENSYEYKGLLLEALGKYEDLEKRGLLVRLPCKAGDSLYKVVEYAKEPIIEMQVTEVTFENIFGDKTIRIETRYYDCNHRIKYEDSYLSSDIGWRVFLTRKEAEANLREINESIMRIGRE